MGLPPPHLSFWNGGANRYDDPRRQYKALYGAWSLEVCFVETVVRSRRRPLILAEAELADRTFETWHGKNLRLVEFHSEPLFALGGNGMLNKITPYEVPQLWSRAIHDHPEQPDGMIFMGRYLETEPCLVLFGRCVDRLEAEGPEPLVLYLRELTVLTDWDVHILPSLSGPATD